MKARPIDANALRKRIEEWMQELEQRRLEYDEQEVWHHRYGLEPFRLWAEAALWVY